MPSPITNLSKLCIHTMTTKPWDLAESAGCYASAGVAGITVWREHIAPHGCKAAAQILKDSGLAVVSLCRGGFFPANTPEDRQKAIDDNLRTIDEAAAIGAPLIVLVCGAVPRMPLPEARKQIAEGIAAVLPHAAASKVRLAIEPLHPMYADCRCAVNTLRQANDMVDQIASPSLGVTVDVFHLWWDPDLRTEIARAGKSIFSFHVSDWRTPTRDLLNDRGLMGEGCINIPQIREWVEQTGFCGFNEVEIFSTEYWAQDQSRFLQKIKDAYLQSV